LGTRTNRHDSWDLKDRCLRVCFRTVDGEVEIPIELRL
jgi:hypothetical protein